MFPPAGEKYICLGTPLSTCFSFLLGVCACVWEANGVGFVVPLHVNSRRLTENFKSKVKARTESSVLTIYLTLFLNADNQFTKVHMTAIS